MNDLSYESQYEKILVRTIDLLSTRPRTSNEISLKIDIYLKDSSLPQTDKENLQKKVLSRLIELSLLDDEEYAVAFIRHNARSNSPVGKHLLSKKMFSKGLDREIVQNAVQNITFDHETMLAQKAYDKKIKTYKKYTTVEKKLRITKYLLSRGFSFDVVYSLVDSKNKVQ